MAASGNFGTPLARFVVSYGAPPKAPVAAFAWRLRPISGRPLAQFVAPLGAPPKTIFTIAVSTTADVW
eukprot:5627510-Pyramimonas_sp.AAC.1